MQDTFLLTKTIKYSYHEINSVLNLSNNEHLLTDDKQITASTSATRFQNNQILNFSSNKHSQTMIKILLQVHSLLDSKILKY